MTRAAHIYFEVRAMPLFGPQTPAASDIARHLQSRQYLGMTVVVCNNPLSMLSATRKQWLRMARNLQKQRASTLNDEEILRFTHTIMHMQHLQFVAQAPTRHVEAQIFFVKPEELTELPPGCISMYITAPPRASQLRTWIDGLAENGLVVDYDGTLGLETMGLEPKTSMQHRMLAHWQELTAYLAERGVHINQLVAGMVMQPAAMDDALDSLLLAGNDFLRRAAEFQHMLSLSQPLKGVPLPQIKEFETVMRLAHRVQSLTPGAFTHHLVQVFGDTNAGSFFLRDAAPEDDIFEPTTEPQPPKETITYEYCETATFMTFAY